MCSSDLPCYGGEAVFRADDHDDGYAQSRKSEGDYYSDERGYLGFMAHNELTVPLLTPLRRLFVN